MRNCSAADVVAKAQAALCVERVHVNEGGQAVIGNVKPATSGAIGSSAEGS